MATLDAILLLKSENYNNFILASLQIRLDVFIPSVSRSSIYDSCDCEFFYALKRFILGLFWKGRLSGLHVLSQATVSAL
jgi:hypothetical protein